MPAMHNARQAIISDYTGLTGLRFSKGVGNSGFWMFVFQGTDQFIKDFLTDIGFKMKLIDIGS
jgi:hypothetical protein